MASTKEQDRDTSESAVTEGDLHTIGRACSDFFGHSSLNPNRFLNNCVSVTFTKILAYRNVHDFWRDTLGGDLPDEALSVDQTINLLEKTGWEYTWKTYQTDDSKSAYHKMRSDIMLQHAEVGPFRAVAYSRGGNEGHCAAADMFFESPHGLACYQKDTYGVDVLHEVEAAQKLLAFWLGPRTKAQKRSWLDRSYWRMTERRKDPIWQARRLQLVNNALDAFGVEPMKVWPGPGVNLFGSDEFFSKYCSVISKISPGYGVN